jgi:UDP-N-acetylmuramate dehydrogenase
MHRVDKKYINEIRDNIGDRVLTSEPLLNHTSYQTGGEVELLVCANNAEETEWIYRFASEKGLPLKVIGAGTNLIAPQRGTAGIILKTKSDEASISFIDNTVVEADAGVPLDTLIREAARRGLGGLNHLAGIPGTVGGAVFMNAGTGGGDTASVIRSVEAVTPSGKKLRLAGADLNPGYRTSIFRCNRWLIVRAEFNLTESQRNKISEEIDRIWKKRMNSYPMESPNAGSVFKNPAGEYAGRLIEEAGCRGLSVGGAKVSEKHSNFIINTGGASSNDIIKLIEMVRKGVYHKFDIYLELEQEIIPSL